MSILKTDNLTKRYKNTEVLSRVAVELQEGRIYGLIGKNGAGKSTFMKLVSGLIFPTQGSIELFGQTSESGLIKARKRIGSMIENPGLIMSMSAKQNLTYHRKLRGIPNEKIEGELLELVGLENTGNKYVKNFSLGMKQRLGIAITLLGNPELIILDEPINGLDPIGVVEIRNLLIKLCKEKHITILISSHNLPELYQVATDYIIIHQGELKQCITLEELEISCKHNLLIQTEQINELTAMLEQKLNTKNYKVFPDNTIRLYDYVDDRQMVAKAIYDAGIIPYTFTLQGDTLENYFINVIGGNEDEHN